MLNFTNSERHRRKRRGKSEVLRGGVKDDGKDSDNIEDEANINSFSGCR
jgi:hypothetical protein